MSRFAIASFVVVVTIFACNRNSPPASTGQPTPPAPMLAVGCASIANGVWQQITPPQVSLNPSFHIPNGFNQYGIGAFVIDPINAGTLYVGTCEQGIYKSTDCGANWVHIDTGRNAFALDTGMQWTMAIDPVDGTLYANAGYSTNWLYRSTNGGVDWDPLVLDAATRSHFQFGPFVETIVIDPSNHQHLLVTMHEPCINGAAAGCLLQSLDEGASWTVINGTWGSAGEGSSLDILSSSTWLYVVPFTNPSGIWRTTDSGQTWAHVYNQFPDPGVARAANGTLYLPVQQGQMIRSQDNGITWTSIAGSPGRSDAIAIINGVIYSSFNDVGNTVTAFPQYMSAPVANDTQWTIVSAAPPMTQGAERNGIAYDPVLQVAYFAEELAGLWRVGFGSGTNPPDAGALEAGTDSGVDAGLADAGADVGADAGAFDASMCDCSCGAAPAFVTPHVSRSSRGGR